MNLRTITLASTIALSTLLSPLLASTSLAAIPCSPNPLIETPETQIMPLIYRELPINFIDLMRGSQPAVRPAATPVASEATPETGAVSNAQVRMAAEGIFRCMNYGESASVLTNATPHFRAFRVGIGNPEAGVAYLDAGSGVRMIQFGTGQQLEDGRWVIDYAAIVDGDDYIAGEMIFVENDGNLYLDEAYLTTEMTLDGETIEIPLSEITTMDIKIYEVSEGDRVVWINESETYVEIQVKDADDNVVFSGGVMSDNMVGGENFNVLPIAGIAPGEYTIVTTFQESGIIYIATLIVAE